MVSPIIRDIRLIGFIVPKHGEAGDYYDVIAWCFECGEWHYMVDLRANQWRGLNCTGFHTAPATAIQNSTSMTGT